MKIYTKTGDRGDTGLFGGGRVSKAHPRVGAYGTVDELNSVLGETLLRMGASDYRSFLARIQHDLFTIGSALATPPPEGARRKPVTPDLPTGRVPEMERWIDRATDEVEPLRNFILPGGAPGAAALHVARTVCRRAERAVIDLAASDFVEEEIIIYLNRLSDLLFSLARLENHRTGTPDVIWRKGIQEESAPGEGRAASSDEEPEETGQ